MKLFKTIKFSFEEKEYEIRIYYSDILINVVAFYNKYPANGFRHQIKISKKLSVNKLLEKDVINGIVEISKNDILERRWEQLT